MQKAPIGALKKATKELNSLENEILNSDKYWELKKKQDIVAAEMTALNAPILEKRTELYTLQQELIAFAVENNQEVTDDYEVKFTESKKVNKEKLFKIIDDIDAYVLLSSVTQKDLKDYAETNNDLKDPLKSCIEVVSRKPTSVTIL